MGRHREWRKSAKRARRKRIRTLQAKYREGLINSNSQDYETWLKEQEALEKIEFEQIEKSNMIENQKWIDAEKIALSQWNLLQKKKEQLHHKYLQQQTKLKMEWDIEQKRKKIEEQKLKEIEEENKKKQEIFMSKLEQFLAGDRIDPPSELLISHQTRPDTESCPFFTKTACCRFGDQCSRNHQYPGISKVLLASNFFVHFGLNNANYNEYDTDLMLEYEDSDTYKEFVEFFNDVTPEFEKFGKIIQFKVCNNYERHLRGNTYIEFAEIRCAVAAYRALHSRWYGGRQLSLQFCTIDSWANAICGLAARKRCPKGRACNFLHVFRNPNNLYNGFRAESRRSLSSSYHSRSWRWSESPEKDKPRSNHSKSTTDKHHRKEERNRSSHHNKQRDKRSRK